MLYKIVNGVAQAWVGEPINGIRHPSNIETVWSNTELNAIGLYKPVAADVIPEGKQASDQQVQIVNGVPKTVYTLEDIPAPHPSRYPLTARQLRLGLVRNNISLSVVQTAINALPTQSIRDEAQIYWEYSTQVNWDHPMTQTLMALVGLNANTAASMWLTAKDYID